MARGNQRDEARAKQQKKDAGKKGKDESGLTPTQRKEVLVMADV